MDKKRGEGQGQGRGGTRKRIGSSGGRSSPCKGGGAGHICHHTCGRSWMVVGCWSPFFDHGGGRLWWSGACSLLCVWALMESGGVAMQRGWGRVCSSMVVGCWSPFVVVGCWSPFVDRGGGRHLWVALGGGRHWLMVLVGAHHHLLVVVMHAHGVVVTVCGCSWWVAEGGVTGCYPIQ